MFSSADHAHMARALRLAERARHWARPNPHVGCVLVRDGEVVGEGFSQPAGGAHAEVEALRRAGAAAAGATAYVTLEPCCHHGRTPPCTDALLRARVSRVVAALRDPYPAVDGGGFAALRPPVCAWRRGSWRRRRARRWRASLHGSGAAMVACA
jgi:diaminohydroxyphosphoribosylaminopyrimidine deaminase/5-amino-6-(5-phosphoribosylamino)uracil reductase